MENILINDNNLTDKDITGTETRVKVILINDKNEILLGYAKNVYQFIGGHVEKGEDLIETAEREIQEETGITLEINKNLKPVAKYTRCWKKEPHTKTNKKIEIYYYILKCNKKINYDKTNYTKEEKKNNFELRYIPIKNFKNEIIENSKQHKNARAVTKEMLELMKRVEFKV